MQSLSGAFTHSPYPPTSREIDREREREREKKTGLHPLGIFASENWSTEYFNKAIIC